MYSKGRESKENDPGVDCACSQDPCACVRYLPSGCEALLQQDDKTNSDKACENHFRASHHQEPTHPCERGGRLAKSGGGAATITKVVPHQLTLGLPDI